MKISNIFKRIGEKIVSKVEQKGETTEKEEWEDGEIAEKL